MARVLPARRWLLVEIARARRSLLVQSARTRKWLLVESTCARRWLVVQSARKRRRLLVEFARAKVVWPDIKTTLEFKLGFWLFLVVVAGVAALGFLLR